MVTLGKVSEATKAPKQRLPLETDPSKKFNPSM
jgi:hypothetical protein